jgi:branched-chain amino acid transport system substrate-binding protein
MKKRLICGALAAVMAMTAFTGCGGKTEGKKDELIIGGMGPLTGETAIYGTAVKNGAQLAVDEINAAGGVNGMKLSLVFQDDENDAEKAGNAYNTIKDKGAKLIIGATTSGCTVVAADKAKEDNMFLITPSGSSVDCVKHDNAFRVCFNDPNQGVASAQYIANNNLGTVQYIR